MNKKLFVTVASILILVAFTLPNPNLDVSAGLFQSPPPNDDFDMATVISALPFTETLDTTEATWASDDPQDCCSNGSVWYAFTPASDTVIEANTFGSDYDTVLSAYTGTRGALSLVFNACNDDYYGLQSRVRFNAAAGTTYYFLIGFCCGHGGSGGGNLVFSMQELPPPPNDQWANAIQITDLPFDHTVDTSEATTESGEPMPSCAYDSLGGTVWYAFSPAESGSVCASVFNAPFETVKAAYTGDSLSGLTEIGCRGGWEPLTFHANAGTTYYFQVAGLYGQGGPLQFHLEVPPPPQAQFWFDPYDPSVFDTVQFSDWSYDPAWVGIESQAWDFGDGATGTGCCPTHRYAADGDYTVQLTVRTYDGRTGSTSQVVQVRTHDVAITKLTVPKAAKAGQTRQIVVGINNKKYPENVEVQLYKSVPGGYEFVGTLTQSVPVRPSNRTTDFKFSYTFTRDNAIIGKVTFKAVAYLVDARDALPADNEAIAAPTKVNR